MKYVSRYAIIGVLVVCMIGVAYAQFAKPEDAIEYRQSVMILIGQHFGRIAAVVQGKTPYDKAAVARDAALVETLIQLPLEAFMMPGAQKGHTHMKPSALKEKASFTADLEATIAASTKLSTVANNGDLNAVKVQFGAVGQTCKACHEKFRAH